MNDYITQLSNTNKNADIQVLAETEREFEFLSTWLRGDEIKPAKTRKHGGLQTVCQNPEGRAEMSEKNGKKRGTWLRLYTTLLNDDVFMTLTDSSVAIFLKLYLLAKRADSEGLTPPGVIGGERGPYTFRQISYHLRMIGQEGVVQAALNELIEAGMVKLIAGEWHIANYQVEQETLAEYASRLASGRESTAAWRSKIAESALVESESQSDAELQRWIFETCKKMGYKDQTCSNYSKKTKAEFLAHLETVSKKLESFSKNVADDELQKIKSAERFSKMEAASKEIPFMETVLKNFVPLKRERLNLSSNKR